jgi:glycosyltransferase involved in cell wall biosynthesis
VRIAFVVPRYGTEIVTGVEYHGRLVAEQLADRHQVDVLTTCAHDAATWKNEYPEGPDRLRGVTVRRFATSRTRDAREAQRYAEWIFTRRHGHQEEVEWLKHQGPWAPGLLEFLERHHANYDVLIFIGCLHPPAVLGMKVAPHKSLLVPAVQAQDDPAFQLGIIQDVFTSAAAIAWNSDAERAFAHARFPLRAIAEDVIGCGVPLPEGEAVAEGAEPPAPPADGLGREPFAPHIEGSANAFRRRHRMHGPFVLYGGRIDPGQGGEELLEYFQTYVKEGGDATLVLMGVKRMPLPEDPHVRFAGTLPDEERLHALEAATVVVVPSPDDGLSLVALEAFSIGTPVLGNARAASLVDHCRRSHAGLYYADRWEFVEALKLLLKDEALRTAMGRNGKAYVNQHYRWSLIESKYEQLFVKLRGGHGQERLQDSTRQAEPSRDRTPERGRDRGRDRHRDWNRNRGRSQNRDRDRGRGQHNKPKNRQSS